ncbi:hypothetical protein O2V63_07455 [Modestobacter sp. VKM Ac-2977]|uniref:hypothetical protein n=1 Tax=Modestobacter sp. VKM Ac-2977 TaxID=3004131 RepID=UPI0022AAC825|nr:hypothetical protein [Modestobacter sp. VKM Ac-2977]MCZ2820159.1 hypothetical protein [Modestobacter sp. VKM Ac-2977]
MDEQTEQRLVQVATDEMRVPFWVVLAGVGVGSFWTLMGVLVGTRVARRRCAPPAASGIRASLIRCSRTGARSWPR